MLGMQKLSKLISSHDPNSAPENLVYYPFAHAGGLSLWDYGTVVETRKRGQDVYVLIVPEHADRLERWLHISEVAFVSSR